MQSTAKQQSRLRERGFRLRLEHEIDEANIPFERACFFVFCDAERLLVVPMLKISISVSGIFKKETASVSPTMTGQFAQTPPSTNLPSR